MFAAPWSVAITGPDVANRAIFSFFFFSHSTGLIRQHLVRSEVRTWGAIRAWNSDRSDASGVLAAVQSRRLMGGAAKHGAVAPERA
jgi:hypothetical protein